MKERAFRHLNLESLEIGEKVFGQTMHIVDEALDTIKDYWWDTLENYMSEKKLNKKG